MNSFEALERVSSKRGEWASLPLESKLAILNEMVQCFEAIEFDEWYQQVGKDALVMMGVPEDTEEGKMEAMNQCLGMIMFFKSELFARQKLYELRVKGDLPEATSYKIRTAINGQVCVETLATKVPLTKPLGPLAVCTGEVWLDPNVVPSENDVKIFEYQDDKDAEKYPGLMLLLGAGNHAVIAAVDSMYGLFTRNCVVYVKLHALRSYTEPLMRKLFDPLIKRGYLEMECHTTNERAAALAKHPLVTAVHLTGGKATHDAIVWGGDPKEQQANKAKNNKQIKAEMTSELGAVSPWIVVPATYKSTELKTQANFLAAAIHTNASCNCNAPKAIVVSDSWEQKDEFLRYLETSLAENLLPVAYYPGSAERWQRFREEYPQAKLLGDDPVQSIKERKLSKALLSKEVTLLPYLAIDLAVDLTNESGREAASKEYAFKNEPFCPVYTVARLRNVDTVDTFCQTASTFCNDFLFGTLSGTVTAPSQVQSREAYQQMIADLKYGGIGVNCWGGFCYVAPEGAWGAYPGESLANVESGIGRIHNVLGVAGFQKFVITGPLSAMTYLKLEKNIQKQTKILQATIKYLLAPGLGSIVGVLAAVVGVDLATLSAVGGAALAIVTGFVFFGRR